MGTDLTPVPVFSPHSQQTLASLDSRRRRPGRRPPSPLPPARHPPPRRFVIVEMNITVKAAHSFVSRCVYHDVVRTSLIKHVDKVPYSVAIRVLRDPYDASTWGDRSMRRKVIYDSFWNGVRFRHTSPSATLRVEPSQTIGSLKSLLETEPWTPKENLVLIQHKERPLEDDKCTLSECGYNGQGGSLLVCMGGSFSLAIIDTRTNRRFDIPVSSCLETLGVLKEKINHVTGLPPEKMKLLYNSNYIRKKDNTRLVALGMVMPYSTTDMTPRLNKIHLLKKSE